MQREIRRISPNNNKLIAKRTDFKMHECMGINVEVCEQIGKW